MTVFTNIGIISRKQSYNIGRKIQTMKNQENQRRKRIFNIFSILTATVILLSLCSALTFVSAAEQKNEIIVENYNISEEYSRKLSEEISRYSELDTSAQKSVSKNVTTAINIYRKELLDLQTHPEVSQRPLSKEAGIAYTKGCSAGKIAWIYFYNLSSLENDAALTRIRAKYEELLEEVASATDSNVLLAKCKIYCSELNTAIYRELTIALAREGDSLECSSIIAGGIEKTETLSSSDIFGKEHLALYEETRSALSLQRARDSLDKDMRSIYALLCPTGNYQSDQTTALLAYKLKNATSVTEMNASMQNTLEKLLEVPESKQYAYLYSSLLKQSISEAVIKANKQNSAADITPIFIDYTINKHRAGTKDEIYVTVYAGGQIGDSELSKIEAYFNAEGGRLDTAVSSEEIDCELIRAQYAKQSYSKLIEFQEEIDVILAPYDKSAFRDRAQKDYEECIDAIYTLAASASFEENCKSSLLGFCEELSVISHECKAERYLLDHKTVIAKPLGEINLSDELKLRSAIVDYCALNKTVQETLLSQINLIVEKYNTVLSQKIRSYSANDALYLDLCELFEKEIKLLPRNNIDVFYNNCDLILQKPEKLCDIIEAYRALCNNGFYESYNAEERETLVKICRDAASDLHDLNIDDKTMFLSDLDSTEELANVEMQRTEQLVRLRIAVRNSQNAQIKAIAAESTARINASFDEAEMSSIANKAIFKIERLLTSDEILVRTEEEKFNIDSLKFLSSEEKEEFKQKINALSIGSRASAEVAENITVLQFIWETFEENKNTLTKEYASLDLSRAQKAYSDSFNEECKSFANSLATMIYLSAEESADFSNRVTSLSSSLKSEILSVQSSKEAEELFLKSLDTLNSLKLSAESLNLKNYNQTLLSKVYNYKNLKDNYSAENYNNILNLIAKLETDLASSKSLNESLELYENAEKSILLVNDLLDDAINCAIKDLEEKIETLRLCSTFYSPEALKTLDDLLSECKDKLAALSDISQTSEAKAIGAEYLQKADLIPRDYATSSPSGLSFTAEGSQYPEGYDTSDGIWGLIYAPNQISAISKLSIFPANADLGAIEREIRNAAKKGNISLIGVKNNDIIKSLKKSNVLLAADITLENISDLGSAFTLQMLLPNDIAGENILGLVFIDGNGNVEFYQADKRDALMSVKLSHLSRYYVVATSSTDLKPIIIILSILAVLELSVIALILYARFQRKRKEKSNMLPMLPCFISPCALAATGKTQPSGAVSAVVLLSVTVLALGCVIALLTKAELRERNLAKKAQTKKSVSKKEVSNLLSSKAPTALLRAKRAELASASEENSPDAQYYPDTSTVIVEEDPAQDKTAGEFDTDVEVIKSLDKESYSETSDHYESARHRAEINLDTIESKFGTNDLVTLDALKRKRLVPKKTDYVKILARGALSKPLVIEANDFSRAAEEMLNAVGGEAIRIKK